ncbi:hypothetical protein HAX54_028147 [Datura stramonium]|uniref:Uncharacterized protein n=1 Tax=Datura stramonium TaxID=4076 RepID=A0ABS8Y598_DATST|nr:hypothetical protein [Datura stramonium]
MFNYRFLERKNNVHQIYGDFTLKKINSKELIPILFGSCTEISKMKKEEQSMNLIITSFNIQKFQQIRVNSMGQRFRRNHEQTSKPRFRIKNTQLKLPRKFILNETP